MSLSLARIQEIEKLLNELLDPELADIIKRATAKEGEPGSTYIKIPEPTAIDFTIDELASIVARTSNTYWKAARDSGFAHAKLKQVERKYKIKYKSSLKGKNTAEREINAIEASASEFIELSLIQSIVELADAHETSARLASESARKLLDKSQAMQIANSRESAGYYMDKDFN